MLHTACKVGSSACAAHSTGPALGTGSRSGRALHAVCTPCCPLCCLQHRWLVQPYAPHETHTSPGAHCAHGPWAGMGCAQPTVCGLDLALHIAWGPEAWSACTALERPPSNLQAMGSVCPVPGLQASTQGTGWTRHCLWHRGSKPLYFLQHMYCMQCTGPRPGPAPPTCKLDNTAPWTGFSLWAICLILYSLCSESSNRT